jgi:hypothetical protein
LGGGRSAVRIAFDERNPNFDFVNALNHRARFLDTSSFGFRHSFVIRASTFVIFASGVPESRTVI